MAKKKVIKSDSGKYKIIQKPLKDYPEMSNTTVRRTVKGVLSGAPNRRKTFDNYKEAETNNLGLRSMARELGAKPHEVDAVHPKTNYIQYMKKQKAGGTIKKKMAIGGGTGDPTTKDPNSYKLHKTGVFGKDKSKVISKEKFDRVNNRLSSNINNFRLGDASTPTQQIEKQGIGKRRVSVSRVNPDMIKANEAKNPPYRRTPPPPPDTRSTNEKVGRPRPTNKPAVSPIRQFKKGGTIKKKK